MKNLLIVIMFLYIQACVYAPSQAWKPHIAEKSKKYHKHKPTINSTQSKENKKNKTDDKKN